MPTRKQIITFITWTVIVCVCGFFIGRCTQKPKTSIKYIKGVTITDSILVPFVIKETVPGEPQWLTKTDTLWRDSVVYIAEKIDTIAILADWIKQRDYQNTLFDVDTLGKLVVSSTVQYNRLQKMKYDFTPVHKQITRYQKPTWEPFVMIGFQTGWEPSLQAGLFYKNFGVAYDITFNKTFQPGQKNISQGFKVGWKF